MENEEENEFNHTCPSCGYVYQDWEKLHRNFGGEIDAITFCMRCKEEV